MRCDKLIEELKEFNPLADISLTVSEDICLSYISSDGTENKSTAKHIFIEPTDSCMNCSHHYMNGDEMWCGYHHSPCREFIGCEEWENWTD